MIDTSPLESLSPEERARLGSEIRKNLGLPPDASDWIVIAILTILVSRMFDRHERLIRKANRLFYLVRVMFPFVERVRDTLCDKAAKNGEPIEDNLPIADLTKILNNADAVLKEADNEKA